ncbi:MAG: hypothetical protein KGL25_01175 [Gammaproteobacteria bacterium]|nr:hypothetical protein [Gammaproteobacteria bacterium]MDE2250003.1 hypothetical protein [Gammaproteobacteria bacterium]
MRLVAAFRGAAECRRESGAVQWRLRGIDRAGDHALEVLLCGAPELRLPARLPSAELYAAGEAAAPEWELRSDGRVLPLAVRSVQVHRGVGDAFARALPPAPVPWRVRAGWVLLLNALRLPGMARLLRRWRGGATDGAGGAQ